MKGSQHFITSFAASIFVGTLLAVAVFVWQESVARLGVNPMLMVPVGFAIGQFVTRWIFKSWVPITCPYGCGNKAHPIPGRHDRFRCHSCGQDF